LLGHAYRDFGEQTKKFCDVVFVRRFTESLFIMLNSRDVVHCFPVLNVEFRKAVEIVSNRWKIVPN